MPRILRNNDPERTFLESIDILSGEYNRCRRIRRASLGGRVTEAKRQSPEFTLIKNLDWRLSEDFAAHVSAFAGDPRYVPATRAYCGNYPSTHCAAGVLLHAHVFGYLFPVSFLANAFSTTFSVDSLYNNQSHVPLRSRIFINDTRQENHSRQIRAFITGKPVEPVHRKEWRGRHPATKTTAAAQTSQRSIMVTGIAATDLESTWQPNDISISPTAYQKWMPALDDA